MKILLVALTLILLVITVAAQPKLELEKKTHKFPKTKEGIKLKHVYHFTNTGNQPLMIDKYEVACPCTKLEYPQVPILPGQSADLVVHFDTKGKIAWQDRIITIYSNAKNSPTKIRFKVMVENDKKETR